MAKNSNLHAAKSAKNDEFYTQLSDIEKELSHYEDHFKGKTVFCNCDDPTWSNFWRYFHMRFSLLGLKKLISTHFEKDGSPSYALIYNGGGQASDSDITIGERIELSSNGDFRSEECVALLDEADIVVTNPPFSLFREYVAQLMEHEKKFIIIGNKNAITYKGVFPLLKEDRVWLGYTSPCEFSLPDGSLTKQMNGLGRWFTNLDIDKRHEPIILFRHYSEEEYPAYDNYDAINVDKVVDIPCDYDGVMGVPITFLDKYCPEQFEIVGLLQSSSDALAGIPNLRFYDDFLEMRQDMTFTGSSGKKANGNPVVIGKSPRGNFLFNPKTKEYVHSVYARITIRRK